MKKKLLCVLMAMVLSLISILSIQAEGRDYKKYKNFKYRFIDDDAILVEYYLGKKTKIKVPEKINGIKVKYIDLERAKNVKEITIPRYVEDVSLGSIKTLKKVKVSKKSKYLSVENNIVLNKKKTVLINVLGGYNTIVVPKTVKTLDIGSFRYAKVKKVVITEKVKKIDNSAFDRCNRLKTVVFKGNTIPKISDTAFRIDGKMKFYVNNKKLGKKLLKELDGKTGGRAYVYVGNKLVYSKKLNIKWEW